MLKAEWTRLGYYPLLSRRHHKPCYVLSPPRCDLGRAPSSSCVTYQISQPRVESRQIRRGWSFLSGCSFLLPSWPIELSVASPSPSPSTVKTRPGGGSTWYTPFKLFGSGCYRSGWCDGTHILTSHGSGSCEPSMWIPCLRSGSICLSSSHFEAARQGLRYGSARCSHSMCGDRKSLACPGDPDMGLITDLVVAWTHEILRGAS